MSVRRHFLQLDIAEVQRSLELEKSALQSLQKSHTGVDNEQPASIKLYQEKESYHRQRIAQLAEKHHRLQSRLSALESGDHVRSHCGQTRCAAV